MHYRKKVNFFKKTWYLSPVSSLNRLNMRVSGVKSGVRTSNTVRYKKHKKDTRLMELRNYINFNKKKRWEANAFVDEETGIVYPVFDVVTRVRDIDIDRMSNMSPCSVYNRLIGKNVVWKSYQTVGFINNTYNRRYSIQNNSGGEGGGIMSFHGYKIVRKSYKKKKHRENKKFYKELIKTHEE